MSQKLPLWPLIIWHYWHLVKVCNLLLFKLLQFCIVHFIFILFFADLITCVSLITRSFSSLVNYFAKLIICSLGLHSYVRVLSNFPLAEFFSSFIIKSLAVWALINLLSHWLIDVSATMTRNFSFVPSCTVDITVCCNQVVHHYVICYILHTMIKEKLHTP